VSGNEEGATYQKLVVKYHENRDDFMDPEKTNLSDYLMKRWITIKNYEKLRELQTVVRPKTYAPSIQNQFMTAMKSAGILIDKPDTAGEHAIFGHLQRRFYLEYNKANEADPENPPTQDQVKDILNTLFSEHKVQGALWGAFGDKKIKADDIAKYYTELDELAGTPPGTAFASATAALSKSGMDVNTVNLYVRWRDAKRALEDR